MELTECDRHIGFILFDDFEDLDFFGPWEVFSVWSQQFNGPTNRSVISKSMQSLKSVKDLTISPSKTFETVPKLDFLLIPGGAGARVVCFDNTYHQYIKKCQADGTFILSVCTGALILHEGGFLKNKTATTHWNSLDRLAKDQSVNVVPERFVKNDKLWLSSGISAGIDMSLAFIAMIAGEKVAGDVQRWMEYYPASICYPNSANHYPAYVKKTNLT